MAESIGIKIASGEFYPLIDAYTEGTKCAVLTTIRDNQPSMQIDFYKSYTRSMVDALYLGSLVIDKIPEAKNGVPSMTLKVDGSEDGLFSASCNGHVLETSLITAEGKTTSTEPGGLPPPELYGTFKRQTAAKAGFPWFGLIAAGVILLLVCGGVYIYMSSSASSAASSVASNSASSVVPSSAAQKQPQAKPVAPPAPAKTPPVQAAKPAPAPAPAAQPAKPVPAPAVKPAPVPAAKPVTPPPVPKVQELTPPRIQRFSVKREHRHAPVYSSRIPHYIPLEGSTYKARWGDTLWDIANAYYHNGYAYTRIAWYNHITNSNMLISGTRIVIPPL